MSSASVSNTEAALAWKERGNAYYGKRDFAEAAKAYQAGMDALDEEQDLSLAIALRSNLAMVLLKLEEYQQADEECTRILQVDPENTKGTCLRVLTRSADLSYLLYYRERVCSTSLIAI
jgi:tetratricopeptide (TPR) repeat protein